MAIERGGIAGETLDAGFGAQRAGAQALERQEFGPAAGSARIALPRFDQRPGPLVDGVVDRDHARHGRGEFLRGRRRRVFAQHRVEELRLGRVDPVAAGRGAGFAFGVGG